MDQNNILTGTYNFDKGERTSCRHAAGPGYIWRRRSRKHVTSIKWTSVTSQVGGQRVSLRLSAKASRAKLRQPNSTGPARGWFFRPDRTIMGAIDVPGIDGRRIQRRWVWRTGQRSYTGEEWLLARQGEPFVPPWRRVDLLPVQRELLRGACNGDYFFASLETVSQGCPAPARSAVARRRRRRTRPAATHAWVSTSRTTGAHASTAHVEHGPPL